MNNTSIFDRFILYEDLKRMEAESKEKISAFLDNDKIVSIQFCIGHVLRNNTVSVGIELESLYQIARMKYYEDERLELTKFEFSWGLSNFILTIGKYSYKLKNFKDIGWVVLDLSGRTIENPYNPRGVSWIYRFEDEETFDE